MTYPSGASQWNWNARCCERSCLHLQVHLHPGALAVGSSWFWVTGSAEDADPCMCAGQDIEIALAARDGFGNAVGDLEPNAVKAVATGDNVSINFEPCEVRKCH